MARFLSSSLSSEISSKRAEGVEGSGVLVAPVIVVLVAVAEVSSYDFASTKVNDRKQTIWVNKLSKD